MLASNFINKKKFNKLKPGDQIVLRFMIGKATVISNPSVAGLTNVYGNVSEQDVIRVRFDNIPWTKKNKGEYELIRQQIKAIL